MPRRNSDRLNPDRLHRLARKATQAAFRGAATAAGAAPIQLAIWWITHK
ncbi:hypothetical protein BJY14_007816 [Actinomadura luteofluorescens]|uniref:Uncharacterized protein n=1 Tax=Actinomadura luteofluorescens TaxID=46163 RepID=A0A7Y9JKN5_9ACTN|nr:hypothetical protein [Actinomadura luteofluorescens]NYD51833.1 hypothetical protein [Actinomadura luteofluorescens]